MQGIPGKPLDLRFQPNATMNLLRRQEGHHFRCPQRHVHRLEDGGDRAPDGCRHRLDQRPRRYAHGRDPQTGRSLRQCAL